MKKLFVVSLVAASVSLTGCVSTVKQAVNGSELVVKTDMTHSIMLDPTSKENHTAFLQIRNTSDKDIDIKSAIASELTKRGYKLVTDPSKAYYWLQANVRKVGKADEEELKKYSMSGYGDALVGAGVGAAVSSGSDMGKGALIGAGLTLAADLFLEDVMYTIVTDLQISEKSSDTVSSTNRQYLSQGTSGSTTQVVNSKGNRIKYQTRIISTARKNNLTFEEALPELERTLGKSISGMF